MVVERIRFYINKICMPMPKEGLPISEVTSEEKSIEEQYKYREVLELPGGKVLVMDIKPENQKSEVPVLMAPGWGPGTSTGMKANVFEMVKQGRRTMIFESPHGIDHEVTEESAKDLPNYFLRQIAALVETTEKENLKKIDVVGNSEGCIYAIMAAYLYPEKFRNIVLIDPGGMIGEDTPMKLSLRFTKEMIYGAIELIKRRGQMSALAKEQMDKGPKEFIKYIMNDPATALREVFAMSKARIYDLLEEIKRNGIGISVVHGVDDGVFPMDRIQKFTKSGTVDGFYSVKGDHTEFLVNPEKYTRLAEQALTALEKKQERKL